MALDSSFLPIYVLGVSLAFTTEGDCVLGCWCLLQILQFLNFFTSSGSHGLTATVFGKNIIFGGLLSLLDQSMRV